MAEHPQAQQTASGVEALISRLREEGVSAGRGEAERLVADAQARAREILGKAEAEAKAKVAEARSEADKLRRAGEDALRVAMRDTVLDLREQIAQRFADDIVRAISSATRDEELLKRMILAVAARAKADAVAAAMTRKAEALRVPGRAMILEIPSAGAKILPA